MRDNEGIYQALLAVTNVLNSQRDSDSLWQAITEQIRKVLPWERAGVHDLHFHDLRHTFTTWLTQCGVDYAVIQTLEGEPLPGSAKYYIHNWNARLRDAVTRLEAFTKAVLNGENDIQVPLQCHLST